MRGLMPPGSGRGKRKFCTTFCENCALHILKKLKRKIACKLRGEHEEMNYRTDLAVELDAHARTAARQQAAKHTGGAAQPDARQRPVIIKKQIAAR